MISETADHLLRKLPLKLAIVGGGRACKFFLESAKNDFFPLLDIQVVGVCDIDPNAEGFLLAREMGIFTTDDFRDLFKIKDLEGIVELTNDEDVFLELVKLRPKGVGVLEHDIGKLIRNLFILSQRLKSAEKQVILEKMSSDFLIQQSDAAIVVLNTDYTIAEANEAYLKIVNKSKAEVVGTPCYQTYYGLNAPCSVARPELPCPMLETLRTGKSAHVIHEFPTTADRQTYGNIVTYPLKDQDRPDFADHRNMAGYHRKNQQRMEQTGGGTESRPQKNGAGRSDDFPRKARGQLRPRNQQSAARAADFQSHHAGDDGEKPIEPRGHSKLSAFYRAHGDRTGALRKNRFRPSVLFP